jgi:MFS transporter, ACS family, glucarate transporter
VSPDSWGDTPAIPKPLSSTAAAGTVSAAIPTTASRTLMRFAVLLAALLYLDRVCISQSQSLISAELGLSKTDMGFIMMMFSLAYAIFEVPGGWLGDRIGPRKVITRIVVWWSAFTMATGLATGFWSLTIMRFLFGVGEAGAFPNLTKAFSNWFVGEDRTRAQAIMWLAARWGGALTPLLVVFVLDFLNWRESFYIFGAIGFFWAFFFFRWFRDTPEQHPGVNAAELARLARPAERHGPGHAHDNAPWTKFFTNRSVWLLCLQYACLSYGFWFYITWLPTYIREVFGLKDADRYLAGALAGLPLFLAGVSVYLTGKVTPWLIERVGSVARVRRGLGATGCGIASLMLVVSVTQQNPVLAMLAMGVSCFGNDMAMPGSWTAVMDLGGRYSGTLAGIMNMMGMVGGLLAPWTIPMILEAAGNWQVPILVLAAAYFVGSLAWLGIDPVTPIGDTGT